MPVPADAPAHERTDAALAGERREAAAALLAEVAGRTAERIAAAASHKQLSDALIDAEGRAKAAADERDAYRAKADALVIEVGGLTRQIESLTAELDKHKPPPPEPPPRLVFPPAPTDIDVRAYGAKGDGRTDDTAAIQRAISENIGKPNRPAVIRLSGRHLVSKSLEWRDATGRWAAYGVLAGAYPADTGLVLPPNCPGFGDPHAPRPVVVTGNNPWPGMAEEHRRNGTGFAAFQNWLADLYVEIGEGNAGAVGVNLRANNNGGLDNVAVRGPGFCGVSCEDKIIGPLLLYRTTAEGCAYGLRLSKQASFYGVTALDCRFIGTKSDVWNDGLLSAEHMDGDDVAGAGRTFRILFDENEPAPAIPNIPPTPPDADGCWTVGDADVLICGAFTPSQMAEPPAGKPRIRHEGKGTLYLCHFQGGAGDVYQGYDGSGAVVGFDVYSVSGRWWFGRQRVRFWQLNAEAAKAKAPDGSWAFKGAKLILSGTDFRAVGVKVEGPGDFVRAANGAKVKVFGGVAVANVPMDGAVLFDLVTDDCAASIEMVADGSAAVQVRRGGEPVKPAKATRNLLRYATQ